MHLPADDPVSVWLRRRYPQRSFLDPNEVTANRNGELTPSQRAALNLKLAQESLIALIFTILGGGLLLFGGSLVLALLVTQSMLVVMLALGSLVVVLLLSLPGLIQGMRRWTEFSAARREIAASEIVFASGQVAWIDDLYTAIAGRKRLKPIYDKLNLPPGAYRFYYLRGGRWLLSAEKLSNEQQPTEANLFLTLSKANRFNQADLEHNRAGWLNLSQIPHLIRPLLIPVTIAIPFGLLVCMFLAPVDVSRILAEPFTLLFVVVGGFWIVSALWRVGTAMIDVVSRRVVAVEGIGQRLRVYQTRGVTYYYYQIGAKRLTVSRSAYNALIIGLRYRAYYAPLSKTLLSIEPLDASSTILPSTASGNQMD